MVQVSEKFRQLATDNGRHVYCRIEAGGEVFLDDRIVEFTLDDVTHPDWFTVGTACANRFHFVARYSGELPSGATVRPFISFDNEEWCSLGTFYISRRYVRRNIISITAYDRMYTLDALFETSLQLPCTSDVLLREICDNNGIEISDCGSAFEVTQLPQECTVRDMIGYIAGLNRACAKFDRSGCLQLRKCTQYDEHISWLNCMDIQRNMTRSKVSCLIAQTDSETLVSGEGAVVDTVEMYNPLMTQDILDQMYSLFKPFSYYGADIVMQGLPYLESGEAMYLLDGAMLYPLVISEMELHYDGGLTGYIYSRNRTVTDSPVTEDDLEEVIKKLSAAAYSLTNDAQIAVGTQPVTVAEFTFSGKSGGFAQLELNVSASESTADFVYFRVIVNGAEVTRSIAHNMEQDTGRHLLHVSHLETALVSGENNITVTAQTGNGDCYILAGAMQASLVVHGSNSNGGGSGGSTAVLTSYAMLSDTSARCNGVTYSVEKDSATGLISKITDDLGGYIIPERADGVTDISTHNAVLWAVAMSRGLRSQIGTLPIFNYGGVSGLNAAYSAYYYETAEGVMYNSMGDGSPDESTLTQDAITLKYLFFENRYRHKWFILATPIRNNFRKLRVTAQVDGKEAAYNVAHFYVGRTFDPNQMGLMQHHGGIGDVVADYYFTNYGDPTKPQSVAETTVTLDISGCVGDEIYIGFHHCCNDLIIKSIALTG